MYMRTINHFPNEKIVESFVSFNSISFFCGEPPRTSFGSFLPPLTLGTFVYDYPVGLVDRSFVSKTLPTIFNGSYYRVISSERVKVCNNWRSRVCAKCTECGKTMTHATTTSFISHLRVKHEFPHHSS